MKINIKNTEALNVAIDTVAGKARQHVHTAPQIGSDAESLYRKLKTHLPAKLLVGTIFRLNSRPSLPRAYGNRLVFHTEVTVEVFPSGLFVTGITKVQAWATSQIYASGVAILSEPVKQHLQATLVADAIKI